MTTVPNFSDWLAERLGTRQWVVAPRLSPYLRSKGYNLALSQKRYAALQAQYDAAQAAAKAERIALALFPDDYHDGTDCRAEVDRIGEPCRVCADNLARWQGRIREVVTALTTEGLL